VRVDLPILDISNAKGLVHGRAFSGLSPAARVFAKTLASHRNVGVYVRGLGFGCCASSISGRDKSPKGPRFPAGRKKVGPGVPIAATMGARHCFRGLAGRTFTNLGPLLHCHERPRSDPHGEYLGDSIELGLGPGVVRRSLAGATTSVQFACAGRDPSRRIFPGWNFQPKFIQI